MPPCICMAYTNDEVYYMIRFTRVSSRNKYLYTSVDTVVFIVYLGILVGVLIFARPTHSRAAKTF